MILYAGAEKYDIDTNEIKGTFSREVLQDIISGIGERYHEDFDFSNFIENIRTELEEEIKLELLKELKKDLKGEAERAIREYMGEELEE